MQLSNDWLAGRLGGVRYLLGSEERRHFKVVQLASDLLGSYTLRSVRNVHVEGAGQGAQTPSESVGGV